MTTPTRRPAKKVATKRVSPRTGKDYAAIAASKITSPSKRGAKPPNILVYGRNKKGKTRFAMSPGKGKVLILDPEHGTDRFLKRDPDVWHITKWEDMDEAYKFLANCEHEYKWVSPDGMTKLSNMALRFVMARAEETDITRKPGDVAQRDYGKAGELVKGMLYNFQNLDMGVILTAQERTENAGAFEEDDDAENAAVTYVPDLPKGVRAAVNSMVDVIGRMYVVKVDKNGEDVLQRRLWLEPSTMYDTGYRSDFVLPKYLANPTVARLEQLMNEGKVTTRNG